MKKSQNTDEVQKMGVITWIKNYGYYYKGWLWVAVFAVLLVFALSFLLRYDGADLRLYTLTETAMDQDTFAGFYEHLSDDYVYDVDGDNTAIIRPFQYTLDASLKGSADLTKLPDELASTDCLAFIVDDAGYDYLEKLCTLRELSFFGVESDADNPYRLTLSDTELFDAGNISDGTHYYLVMKYIENSEYNNIYVSGRTDILVGLARNNDRNEENDVVIQKK